MKIFKKIKVENVEQSEGGYLLTVNGQKYFFKIEEQKSRFIKKRCYRFLFYNVKSKKWTIKAS